MQICTQSAPFLDSYSCDGCRIYHEKFIIFIFEFEDHGHVVEVRSCKGARDAGAKLIPNRPKKQNVARVSFRKEFTLYYCIILPEVILLNNSCLRS
jgi:hypothetical protein